MSHNIFEPMSHNIFPQWASTCSSNEPPHVHPMSHHMFIQWTTACSSNMPPHDHLMSHHLFIQWAAKSSYDKPPHHGMTGQNLYFIFGRCMLHTLQGALTSSMSIKRYRHEIYYRNSRAFSSLLYRRLVGSLCQQVWWSRLSARRSPIPHQWRDHRNVSATGII